MREETTDWPQKAGGKSAEIEKSRRQNEVGNMGVPLCDGGQKKFNWASELSTP